MITCNLMGGLGNQLFQIFATLSYAFNNKEPFCFLHTETLGNRITYWNTFLSHLKKFTVNNLPKMHVIRESGFHYNELTFDSHHSNICLQGYFQSYKYFENNYETICKFIKLEEQKTLIRNKYAHDYETFTSMHFRVGDYKNIQQCHPIMSYEYYNNCMKYIMEKTNNTRLTIFYFCEKEDDDIVGETINKLQIEHPSSNFIKIDFDIADWEQVLMMSLCRYNIIANSSFSWFGAYFNSQEDKIICYPEVWFGHALSNTHNTKDLCPNTWSKISCN